MSTEQKVMAAPNLQDALNRYLDWRGIGQSAVDLIPADIRHPKGPMDSDKRLDWTHTPGHLKWGVWMVRQAWEVR